MSLYQISTLDRLREWSQKISSNVTHFLGTTNDHLVKIKEFIVTYLIEKGITISDEKLYVPKSLYRHLSKINVAYIVWYIIIRIFKVDPHKYNINEMLIVDQLHDIIRPQILDLFIGGSTLSEYGVKKGVYNYKYEPYPYPFDTYHPILTDYLFIYPLTESDINISNIIDEYKEFVRGGQFDIDFKDLKLLVS